MSIPILRSYIWRRGHRFLRAQLAPTHALSAPFCSSSAAPEQDSLQKKLWEVPIESPITKDSVIEQLLEHGEPIKLSRLRLVRDELHSRRRYIEALAISDLMIDSDPISDLITDSDQWGDKLTSVDIAARLELIGEVHGLEEAEMYFNSFSESSLDHRVYLAMLNCYTRAKQVEKAEALMLKMQDSGFLEPRVFYLAMLRMYARMGNEEKIYMLMDVIYKEDGDSRKTAGDN